MDHELRFSMDKAVYGELSDQKPNQSVKGAMALWEMHVLFSIAT